MAQRIQFRRLLALTLLLCAAFLGLGYRLVDLQVHRHEELETEARRNVERRFLHWPRRGDILDARGHLLATSLLARRVCADPTLLGGRQAEVARALAPWLQRDEAALRQLLLPRLYRRADGSLATNRYVVLKHKVPEETWQAIQRAMSGLSFGVDEAKLPAARRTFYHLLRRYAVFAEPDALRTYPNQSLAAHLLGYVSRQERQVDGHQVLETVGMDGLERAFQASLAGVPGWRSTETDGRRREIVPWRNQEVAPRDGLNVVLTVDSVLQHILESALAEAMEKHQPLSAAGLVVRPRTGEILALATLPSFDPNRPGDAPPEARRNRIITDVMEPGSTFKIVAVSAALNEGVVRLTDTLDCEHGRFTYAGRILHDHEPYGALSVQEIVAKSSNIGAAKIGIRLGDARLYEYIRRFGFGSRTGIPLPGEVAGSVAPVRNWYRVSLAQIPMGHGISVTRLQMTLAMCAIANGGVLMRPMLVRRLEDRQGNLLAQYAPQAVRRVLAETTARDMVTALKAVATPAGTAPKAALEYYTVAGKTGTAQKAGEGGYLPGKYVASFIGFLPADHPELCVAIVLDEPKHGYYGGQVAAPTFRQVAQLAANYLHLRPDRGAEPAAPPALARTVPPAGPARGGDLTRLAATDLRSP